MIELHDQLWNDSSEDHTVGIILKHTFPSLYFILLTDLFLLLIHFYFYLKLLYFFCYSHPNLEKRSLIKDYFYYASVTNGVWLIIIVGIVYYVVLKQTKVSLCR